jgi:hypothetical protein
MRAGGSSLFLFLCCHPGEVIRHLLVVPPGPLPCEGEAKFSGSGSTYVVSTLYGDLAPLSMHEGEALAAPRRQPSGTAGLL